MCAAYVAYLSRENLTCRSRQLGIVHCKAVLHDSKHCLPPQLVQRFSTCVSLQDETNQKWMCARSCRLADLAMTERQILEGLLQQGLPTKSELHQPGGRACSQALVSSKGSYKSIALCCTLVWYCLPPLPFACFPVRLFV